MKFVNVAKCPKCEKVVDWAEFETLNYPRLEGEGFKWGRFEIDHRPRGQAPPLAH
jgi:hypothetical protein